MVREVEAGAVAREEEAMVTENGWEANTVEREGEAGGDGG